MGKSRFFVERSAVHGHDHENDLVGNNPAKDRDAIDAHDTLFDAKYRKSTARHPARGEQVGVELVHAIRGNEPDQRLEELDGAKGWEERGGLVFNPSVADHAF